MMKKLTKTQQAVVDYLKANLRVETDFYRSVHTEATYLVTETTVFLGDEIVSTSKSSTEVREPR